MRVIPSRADGEGPHARSNRYRVRYGVYARSNATVILSDAVCSCEVFRRLMRLKMTRDSLVRGQKTDPDFHQLTLDIGPQVAEHCFENLERDLGERIRKWLEAIETKLEVRIVFLSFAFAYATKRSLPFLMG